MGILPSLNHFLILGAIVFSIGVVGVFEPPVTG